MADQVPRVRGAMPVRRGLCLYYALAVLVHVLLLAAARVGVNGQPESSISVERGIEDALMDLEIDDATQPQRIVTTNAPLSSNPSPVSFPKPSSTSSPKPGTKPSPKPSSTSPESSPTSSPKPTTKSSPKPTTNPSPKPTTNPSPKPTTKPAPKPTSKSSPISSPKSSPSSSPKPTAKPSPKPSPTQAPKSSPPKPSRAPPRIRAPSLTPRRLAAPRPPKRSTWPASSGFLRPPSLFNSTPPTPPPPDRTKNGLRLVRGRGDMGRLEAHVVPDFFLQTGYSQNGGWAPLCDDGSFDDQRAQEFCQIMGYKFGRKHFRNGISTRSQDEPEPRPNPLGHLKCDPADQPLPSFPVGKIDLPDSLGIKCLLFGTACEGGKLVALQCSDKPLKPKPPPPPSPPKPPLPPPPAPRMRHAIRLVPLEDNLLEVWQHSGILFSEPLRVELLVNTSTTSAYDVEEGADAVDVVANSKPGAAVWAPLCVSADQAEALKLLGGSHEVQVIANTSCHQYEDFPNTWFSWTVGKEQSPVPFPTDVSPSDDKSPMFDPSLYTYWVTVVGGAVEGLLSLQQMQLQVGTEPCKTGFMFAVTCDILIV